MNADLNKEINRVKGLKGNKNKSEEQLIRQASINIKVREFHSNPLFNDRDEIKLSEKKFRSYLEANELESMSEIDSLRSLIFTEVLEIRIQKELNKLADDKKTPNEKTTKQLTDIQNQKLVLRAKIGIDKADEVSDEMTGLEILKHRFKDYILKNKQEFSITCPHGEVMLLRKRVKDFDAMKHPWFAGRWLFNYEIMKDVKKKVLSKEDAWRYTCCASQGGEYKPAFDKKYCVDYINYCLNNWAEITAHFDK